LLYHVWYSKKFVDLRKPRAKDVVEGFIDHAE